MIASKCLKFIDTHCHFDFAPFASAPETHWQFCQRQGLAGLVIAGVNRALGSQLPAYCQGRPWAYALGLHPYFVSEHQYQDLDWLEQQLQLDNHILAVGELGVDTFAAKTAQELTLQQQYFTAQVELAAHYRKSLILHVRGKHDELCSFLRHKGFTYGGVVHAFSGSEQQAKAWLNLGFKLGIGGAMTHPRAHKLRRTIQALPADAWLLETDSPDMRSAFWQRPHHSPAAIPLLAACLASVQRSTLSAVAEQQKQSLQALWPSVAQWL